jgi:hypothetical protein
VLLVNVVLADSLRAASAERRHYTLRADEAALAFREFAAASGREILFAAASVRGVKTSPVRGEFSAFEALTRMLAGTALYALEDARTGAFAVRRRPKPRSRSLFRLSKWSPIPAAIMARVRWQRHRVSHRRSAPVHLHGDVRSLSRASPNPIQSDETRDDYANASSMAYTCVGERPSHFCQLRGPLDAGAGSAGKM